MIGQRLLRARKAAGLSLRELAERTCMSHTAISKFEKGLLTPSSGQLIEFAKTLGVRGEFFFRPMQAEVTGVEYRKKASMPKRLLDRVHGDVLDQAERWQELLSLYPDSPIEAFSVPRGLIDTIHEEGQVETLADGLRQAWSLGTNPIPDFIDTLESKGILVIGTVDDCGWFGADYVVFGTETNDHDFYPPVSIALELCRRMPSTLSWVDHDAAARERSLRILALFTEKDTRDELGLGAIRDSLADQLFPGTSTIQTRLRYFLFVPWVYRQLEASRVPSSAFGAQARKLELALIAPLMDGDDQAGVFGKARGRLKRLPSSVYWAGLKSWDIRRFDLSQEQYHRSIDALYRARVRGGAHLADGSDNAVPPTWHPRLPEPPAGFPTQLDFALPVEEAEFLRDRMAMTHPQSLLAHLALRGRPAAAEFAWTHPDLAAFPANIRELLDHGRLFSEVMAGAAILYNLLLAELDEDPQGLVDTHREGLAVWAGGLDALALSRWDLGRLWELVLDHGHRITPATRHFVTSWLQVVRAAPQSLADQPQVRDLIRRREMVLKKARSRFSNRQARLQWSGHAGMGRMAFRWPSARKLLDDLFAGLGSV